MPAKKKAEISQAPEGATSQDQPSPEPAEEPAEDTTTEPAETPTEEPVPLPAAGPVAPPDTFDPTEHLRQVQGGALYLDVKWRVKWFRDEHPEGSIETELQEVDRAVNGGDAYARFRAVVTCWVKAADGDYYRARAVGHGTETASDFGEYLEKAETKAIGRALAMLGYGTQFVDLDGDLPEHLADSGVNPAKANGGARGGGSRGSLGPTERQASFISTLCAERGLDADTFAQKHFGQLLDQLPRNQIGQMIDRLKDIPASRTDRREHTSDNRARLITRIGELFDELETTDEQRSSILFMTYGLNDLSEGTIDQLNNIGHDLRRELNRKKRSLR